MNFTRNEPRSHFFGFHPGFTFIPSDGGGEFSAANHHHVHHHHYHHIGNPPVFLSGRGSALTPHLFGFSGHSPLTSNRSDVSALFSQLLSEVQLRSTAETPPPQVAQKSAVDALPEILLTHDDVGNAASLRGFPVRSLLERAEVLGCEVTGLPEKGDLVDAIVSAAAEKVFPGSPPCSASSLMIENSENGCDTLKERSSKGYTYVPLSRCFDAKADRTCTVCFEDFTEGDVVTRLPCGHWFHAGIERCDKKNPGERGDLCCPGVKPWLTEHGNSCPNCKALLPDVPEDSNNPKESPLSFLLPIAGSEGLRACNDTCGIPEEPPESEQPSLSSPESAAAPFSKNDVVEYFLQGMNQPAVGFPNAAEIKDGAASREGLEGAWEAATILDVGYDENLEPFYTVRLHSTGRERGTVQSRLRHPTSSRSRSAVATHSSDASLIKGAASASAGVGIAPSTKKAAEEVASANSNPRREDNRGHMQMPPLKRSRS